MMDQGCPLEAEFSGQETHEVVPAYSILSTVKQEDNIVNKKLSVNPPEEWPLEPCEKELNESSDERSKCTVSAVEQTRECVKEFPQKVSKKMPPVLSLQAADGSVIYYEQRSQHKRHLEHLKAEIRVLKRRNKRLRASILPVGSPLNTGSYQKLLHEIQTLAEEHQAEFLSIKISLETHMARYRDLHNSYIQAVNNILVSHQNDDV